MTIVRSHRRRAGAGESYVEGYYRDKKKDYWSYYLYEKFSMYGKLFFISKSRDINKLKQGVSDWGSNRIFFIVKAKDSHEAKAAIYVYDKVITQEQLPSSYNGSIVERWRT